MDHQRKDTSTPKRFLSVRAQRTTSSAASSVVTSPRFLSCRQATTPSRPGVALHGRASATASSGARLREPWPAFGDAVQQREAADTVFGIRKRNAATRATIVNGRPTTAAMRPASLGRRLQSDPGAKATGAVSSSPSPATAVTGKAFRKSSTRLSPTALDWVPRANALSPRLSSLSYADVARIGDGRPPPPFPILRRLNNPRASSASTGIIARPGANSSIATGSGNGSEMDDVHDSDKENNVTIPATQPTGLLSTSAMVLAPDSCKTPDDAPSCDGLGDDLGLLRRSADEGFSIGASDNIAVALNFINAAMARPDRGGGKGFRRLLHTPAQRTPAQHTPAGNTPAGTTPSSHGFHASATPASTTKAEKKFLSMQRNAQLHGWAASPFLPKTVEEYTQLVCENLDLRIRRLKTMQQQAESKQQTSVAQSNQSRPVRQFCGGKNILEGQAHLGQDSTIQPVFQPIDGSTAVLGRRTAFSDRLLSYGQAEGSFDPQVHTAPWPSTDEPVDAGRDDSRELPRPRAPAPPGTKGGQGSSNMNYPPSKEIPDRWDWISPAERARLFQAPPVEIDVADVHGPLQNLMAVIDNP